jgi:hypothetical protein
MVTISLHDTLRFTEEPEPAIRLRCHGGVGVDVSVPAGDDNLVVKAAKLLQDRTGTRRGVTIDLWKRIPMSAGLAGGSTDAAAALLALDRLWELHFSSEAFRRRFVGVEVRRSQRSSVRWSWRLWWRGRRVDCRRRRCLGIARSVLGPVRPSHWSKRSSTVESHRPGVFSTMLYRRQQQH